MTFEALGVPTPITRALAEIGFEAPMPVQEAVIPLLLGEGKDIIVLAQTGTGKTAAFGVPLLSNLTLSERYPQALVLAPTRELCLQITSDLSRFGVHLPGLNLLAVYGGSSIEEQIRHLRRGVHLLVATPGRLHDLVRRGEVDLSLVQDVVLDEADEMLAMGFREDLNAILAEVPEERHLLLFSATMQKEIRQITRHYMQQPQEVVIGARNVVNQNIEHHYYVVRSSQRYLALKRIVDLYPSIYGIIFCKTRNTTKEVAEQLQQDGYNAEALHGELSQAERDRVMERFRIGRMQLLVATDVAARGLDVDDLTHVLHFGLPSESEIYTHRSGRTARAGKKGLSVAICHEREVGLLRQIEERSGIKSTRQKLPTPTAICEAQMQSYLQRLLAVEPRRPQLAPFLQQLQEQLEYMGKSELLERVLSLELERLLSYYNRAEELEDVRERKGKEKGKQRGGKMQLLRLNFGKRDRLYPNILIDMINQSMEGEKIPIGKIDIKDRFCTFEVPTQLADMVTDALNLYEYNGRPLRATYAPTPHKRKA